MVSVPVPTPGTVVGGIGTHPVVVGGSRALRDFLHPWRYEVFSLGSSRVVLLFWSTVDDGRWVLGIVILIRVEVGVVPTPFLHILHSTEPSLGLLKRYRESQKVSMLVGPVV